MATSTDDYYEKLKVVFSRRMRAAMDRKGFNEHDISKRVGVSQSMVTCYTNGHNIPSIRHALRLSAALGVPLDWLFGRTLWKKGIWEPDGHVFRCSICKRRIAIADRDTFAYCPGCGAKMKGSDE